MRKSNQNWLGSPNTPYPERSPVEKKNTSWEKKKDVATDLIQRWQRLCNEIQSYIYIQLLCMQHLHKLRNKNYK